MLTGTGVSSGIGIGNIYIKTQFKTPVRSHVEDVKAENKRLEKALQASIQDLNDIYDSKKEELSEKNAAIFKAHIMFLEDEEFIGKMRDKITSLKLTAEYSAYETTTEFVDLFENMGNDYFRQRATDIRDVGYRLIKKLEGVSEDDLSTLPPHTIIVANDLTPSDTAQLNKDNIEGFITEVGGSTSHSAIIARIMNIPAIVGIHQADTVFRSGDKVIIDGSTGEIMIDPSVEELYKYSSLKHQLEEEQEALMAYLDKKSVTKDGHQVKITGNIVMPNNAQVILDNGGDGIGLFRSEFLYMNRDTFPTEEEQFNAYKQVATVIGDLPVIIRTMDIGGDKELDYVNIDNELNPFLGFRAIRYCLEETEVFKTQIRALLRASAYGDIRIMIPMISSYEEVVEAKKLIEECKIELIEKNVTFNQEIQVGIMIEVPSAALMSDMLAREVDFFSIGTNDLIQYTTATDRMNDHVKHLYTPYHPAVLRLIKQVIDAGHKEGIEVGMCGSAAANPLLSPIYLAMGLDKFSMNPSSILKTRKLFSQLSKKDLEETMNQVLTLPTSGEVKQYLRTAFS